MKIELVLVTFNRLNYTKLALEAILADPDENFSLTIWDNASTDDTPRFLKNSVKNDPRIKDIILSKKNGGQTAAMNYVWSTSNADLLGKIDNDCRVTPGWTKIFAKAHQDIPDLGAVACWHFPIEDFDINTANDVGNIQTFGKHSIFRHPWVCGSGFLMKNDSFKNIGNWQEGPDIGTTYYFLKMAKKGLINGWYYPFVIQEHMDDPKSKHCILKDDHIVKKMKQVTYVLRTNNINSLQQRWDRRKFVLKNLNKDPWHHKYYSGWRRQLKKINNHLPSVSTLIK